MIDVVETGFGWGWGATAVEVTPSMKLTLTVSSNLTDAETFVATSLAVTTLTLQAPEAAPPTPKLPPPPIVSPPTD